MKKLLALILCLSFSNAFASEVYKVSVDEIKEHLSSINPETTCMDEYLGRRKQLFFKLTASPVITVGAGVASVYVSGISAAAIANATGATGWNGLGYVIGAAMLGGAAGIVAGGVDTTITGITFYNINMILKAIAEQHLQRGDFYTNNLYAKFLKYAPVQLSKEEFVQKLMAADASGTLCDGSMVKQPRFKLGFKLKYKVAKLKELSRNLGAQL